MAGERFDPGNSSDLRISTPGTKEVYTIAITTGHEKDTKTIPLLFTLSDPDYKPPEYLHALLNRPDVAEIFQGENKAQGAHLEYKTFGDEENKEEYLVITRGEIRYIIDLPEDPAEPVKRFAAKDDFTMVIPTEKFTASEWHEEGFRSFNGLTDVAHFLRFVEHNAYFMRRNSGPKAESNTRFLQPIPCIIAHHHGDSSRIMFTRRSEIATATGSEARLNGTVNAPFVMGHIDTEDVRPGKSAIVVAAIREAREEAAFQNTNGEFVEINGRHQIRHHYSLGGQIGLIFTPNADELERVHIGIVFHAYPQEETTHKLILHPNQHETDTILPLSLDEYRQHVLQGVIRPSNWTQAVMGDYPIYEAA